MYIVDCPDANCDVCTGASGAGTGQCDLCAKKYYRAAGVCNGKTCRYFKSTLL